MAPAPRKLLRQLHRSKRNRLRNMQVRRFCYYHWIDYMGEPAHRLGLTGPTAYVIAGLASIFERKWRAQHWFPKERAYLLPAFSFCDAQREKCCFFSC